jgi:hypothetical protein
MLFTTPPSPFPAFPIPSRRRVKKFENLIWALGPVIDDGGACLLALSAAVGAGQGMSVL